jgi:hypothetical protein
LRGCHPAFKSGHYSTLNLFTTLNQPEHRNRNSSRTCSSNFLGLAGVATPDSALTKLGFAGTLMASDWQAENWALRLLASPKPDRQNIFCSI